MKTLSLTVAVQDTDQVRDLATGEVRAKGIDILPLTGYRPHEIFYRYMHHREWEVSELSFGYYCSMVADGDDSTIAIPVFPARVFRHSSIYIRADGSIKTAKDLAGKRIGIPEWAMTAAIYIRGWLTEQIGLSMADITWIQGGVNEPGRTEKVAPQLPPGFRLTMESERSLSDMLLAGDLDAIFCAAPPAPMKKGDPRIARLFPDARQAEEAYFRETGVYPIMHVIAIRRDIYDANRWVAKSLYDAFEEAKNRSVERLSAFGSLVPLPWCYDEVRRIRKLMFPDGDFWPYGLEPNRKTIEAFVRYCHAQGVSSRLPKIEELFAPETLGHARE